MNCFLLLDDEKKLSTKDIEWSDLNIPITGGHTKGLGNHEESWRRGLEKVEERCVQSLPVY